MRTAGKKIRILDEGILLTDSVDSIDFTGAGIAGSASGNDVTEIVSGGGGGGGVTFETPTGSVNSVNVTFTVTNVPAYIIADGITYFENNGYTRSILTLTLSSPPSVFIKSAY